jgi:hypothetical protein
MGLQHEVDFEQLVIGGREAEPIISLPRAFVVRVHVKAQAADVGPPAGEFVQMTEQGAEHAAAATGFDHEHTLNPPEISVAPIAPLVSDEELTGERAVGFGDEINSFRGIAQQSVDAGGDAFGLKLPMLGFERETEIAIRDEGGVGGFGWSDEDVDASC